MIRSTLAAAISIAALCNSSLAQALELSGGHVAVASSSALVPQAGLTIEAWILPEVLGFDRPTVVRKNPSPNQESYVLRVEFNRPQFSVRTANGFFTLWPNTSINPNTPHHLAATYDGVTSRLYLDGNQIGELVSNGGPLADTGGELRIGRGDDVSGGETFFGDIDAVRLWDRALVPHEIVDGLDRELPFGSGLIASWNFDSDTLDETGNHPGSAVAATGFASEFQTFTESLEISLAGAFVEVPNAPELMPSTGLTIEAWVEQAGGTARPTIVRKDPTPFAESYTLRIEFGWPQFTIQTASGLHTLWAQGVNVPVGSPAHIAATYDGATMALYMDGVLIDSMPATFGPLAASSGPLQIGQGDSTSEKFVGKIDSVRLWSVGLAADDIAYLRNRDVANVPGMIASWNFDGDLTDSTGSHDGAPSTGSAAFAEQFGDQIGSVDSGLSNYGAPTSTCGTSPRMYAASLPELGNGDFAFGSYGGTPGTFWIHILGLDDLPLGIPALGFQLHVNPTLPLTTTAGVGSVFGASRQALPIPATSTLTGFELFAQGVWADGCGPNGFSSTDGLAIRLVN